MRGIIEWKNRHYQVSIWAKKLARITSFSREKLNLLTKLFKFISIAQIGSGFSD